MDRYWRDDALCRQVDTELFFLEAHSSMRARVPKAVCLSCPVMMECRAEFDRLEKKLTYRELHGVVGGETAVERWRRRQRVKKAEREARREAA